MVTVPQTKFSHIKPVKNKRVDEKFYKEFKQKAHDIDNQLQHVLEAMHLQKWQNRR